MIILKKQILAGALALSIIVSGTAVLADESTEKIQDAEVISENVESEDILDLLDVETYDKDGTTMVPLREIAEGILGLDVKWNNESRSVEIGSGPQWTSITIGENSYFFAKMAPFKLSQAPEIKDDLTYVPVEFFSEVLRYEIESEVYTPEEKILSGFIKGIEKTDKNIRLLVAGNEKTTGLDEILLAIVDETIVVDKEGKEFKVENLKVGTKIKAILPEIMTMSLPPQGTAVKIIVENIDVYIEDTIDTDNEELKHPVIVGLEDELDKEINHKIKEYIKEIKENDLYKDLKLGYEISLLSDEKISIIFNGTFDFNNSEKTFVKSLNFDLKTGEEINFESYFDSSEESQEKLGKVLQKAAKNQLDMDFEAEGKQIYFRGSQVVVYYYPLDDSVTSPVYLHLSLDDVESLINK